MGQTVLVQEELFLELLGNGSIRLLTFIELWAASQVQAVALSWV